MSLLFGIARETIYSPGKVEADRRILEEVAEGLRARHTVRVLDVDAALRERRTPDVVFAMCQGPAGLALLRDWERRGVRVVNSAAAIAGCQRDNSLRALLAYRLPLPESRSLRTGDAGALPPWVDGETWIKRGDVHAVESGDVTFCRGRSAALSAFDDLRRRGVATAVVQRHVAGDVLKFYAAPVRFLRCYRAGEPAPAARTEPIGALAQRAGEAVGVEVFGGDLVRDADGTLWLIDVNDWPSYAPCRSAAASAIVDFLDEQGRVSQS